MALERQVITLPAGDEYTEGQQRYVTLASAGEDVISLLAAQPEVYRHLVARLSEEAASARPAPGEWSVKEVIGHVADAERVFAYRMVALARGESQTLLGFDHNQYVEKGRFNERTLASLLDEFAAQRHANLLAIAGMGEAELATRGRINTYQQTVRALVFIMAGHAEHHIVSFKTDYGLG
jgi:uncharacterized damage-inducible protein DinB